MGYKFVKSIYSFVSENKTKEVESLKKQLKELEDWFYHHTYGKEGHEHWDDKSEEAAQIRKKLFELTGSYTGEPKVELKKPNGLYDSYNHPLDVPIDVYRWIYKKESLLYSDATDAIRWSRIINTKNDERYPNVEITIYRAVENKNYSEIREGDWVTTDEKYAIEHNNRYFDGRGKVISMEVNGIDVLVSPTGNHEEAIYAPMGYSIDIDIW